MCRKKGTEAISYFVSIFMVIALSQLEKARGLAYHEADNLEQLRIAFLGY